MSETKNSETWCGMTALAVAPHACACRKQSRSDAILFRLRKGEEVLSFSRMLEEARYPPELDGERRKYREVYGAAYRERVAHHLLNALLERGTIGLEIDRGPEFEAGFGAASSHAGGARACTRRPGHSNPRCGVSHDMINPARLPCGWRS